MRDWFISLIVCWTTPWKEFRWNRSAMREIRWYHINGRFVSYQFTRYSLNFLQIEWLFPVVVDFQNHFPLIIRRHPFPFAHRNSYRRNVCSRSNNFFLLRYRNWLIPMWNLLEAKFKFQISQFQSWSEYKCRWEGSNAALNYHFELKSVIWKIF